MQLTIKQLKKCQIFKSVLKDLKQLTKTLKTKQIKSFNEQ